MAKDPAFLFYPGDWLGGTLGMSFEEKGAYLDLLIYQFNKGSFSEKQALSILKNNDIWEVLKEKFYFDNGLYFNKKLKGEQEKRQNFTESRRQSRKKSDEDNVRIYIVRDNVRLTYKIGSSVNPVRRYNELSNQINPAIMQDVQGNRNISLIWYSNSVLRSEEKKLHTYFKTKHLTGEWFNLIDTDLDYIFNKFSGTYLERTLGRTENENINENTISVSKGEKKTFNTKPIFSDFNGLPENYIINSIELVRITAQFDITEKIVVDMWNIFKNQKLTGCEYYANEGKVYSHFLDWIKKQKFTNGTYQSATTGNKFTAGAEKLLAKGQRVYADITGKQGN